MVSRAAVCPALCPGIGAAQVGSDLRLASGGSRWIGGGRECGGGVCVCVCVCLPALAGWLAGEAAVEAVEDEAGGENGKIISALRSWAPGAPNLGYQLLHYQIVTVVVNIW